MFPLCLSDELFANTLLSIFLEFEAEFSGMGNHSFENFSISDAYERLCDELIANDERFVFCQIKNILRMLIKIKIRKNKYE